MIHNLKLKTYKIVLNRPQLDDLDPPLGKTQTSRFCLRRLRFNASSPSLTSAKLMELNSRALSTNDEMVSPGITNVNEIKVSNGSIWLIYELTNTWLSMMNWFDVCDKGLYALLLMASNECRVVLVCSSANAKLLDLVKLHYINIHQLKCIPRFFSRSVHACII